MEERPKKHAVCKTCTIQLVEICYRRTWWFRLFREPMVLGMRAMARWHRIDARDYEVRTDKCYACVRFMKTALKEQSLTFRLLNNIVNPLFNRVRNGIVTPEEIEEARRFARESTNSPGN